MKTKEVHIRISEKRFSKLKNYATLKEKTVTQIIEDYIDRLPSPVIGDSALRAATRTSTPLPNQPDG
jgi:hypothetical protein